MNSQNIFLLTPQFTKLLGSRRHGIQADIFSNAFFFVFLFFFFQYSRFPFKEGKQFLIFSLQVSFPSSPVPNPPSHSRPPNVFIYRRSDPIGGTLEVASRYSVDPSPEAASPPTWVGV
jgi:hypothetical protein